MDDELLDYESSDSPEREVEAFEEEIDDEQSKTPKDDLDAIIDESEKIATEEAFGITGSTRKHLYVSVEESAALRKELGAGSHSELNAVLVHGVEKMNEFQIQKMFGNFRPEEVWKDGDEAIVMFQYKEEAAAMMLNMSKMIRRVRGRKKADEEGEVMSEDEDLEEGQIMQEKGDDVELIEGLQPNEKGIVEEKTSAFVTVDVSARKLPDGKWRVVTKHVPGDMFVIVRFPTMQEYQKVQRSRTRNGRVPMKREREVQKFWSHESSNRGGLNVFDKEGKELEWDYEHDTRFYDDDKKEEKVEKVQLPTGIKVRGRGSVRCGFLFGEGSSSLASDDASPTKRRKVSDGEQGYEKDDVVARMGNAAHAIRPGRVERPIRDRIKFPERK